MYTCLYIHYNYGTLKESSQWREKGAKDYAPYIPVGGACMTHTVPAPHAPITVRAKDSTL